jgi:short-subunit dehydrogenase
MFEIQPGGGQGAVITGASSGIGLATAHRLAKLGIRVYLLSNVEPDLRDAVQAIRQQGGEAEQREVDLTHPSALAGLLDGIEKSWGPVDLLVNCAGIGYNADVVDLRPEVYRTLFEVNFFALVELSQQALRLMGARGRGHIVNVTSASARRSLAKMGAYAASKAAAHAFTQSLRIESSRVGVGVSEVLPISVRTNFFRDSATSQAGKGYRPRGLVQTPEQIAELIVKCIRENRAEACSHWLTGWGLALDGVAPNWVAKLLSWLESRRGA